VCCLFFAIVCRMEANGPMAQDVRQWLEDLGLGEYADAFEENAVDSDVLPSLTNDDLKDIGVTAVGKRRKLLNAIAN
jgi:hypothetical protein